MKLRNHSSSVQLRATATIKFRGCAGDFASLCEVCGSLPAKSDFSVPDDTWKIVVPTKYWNGVVCVECFGNFACEKQIELLRLLSTLLVPMWSYADILSTSI